MRQLLQKRRIRFMTSGKCSSAAISATGRSVAAGGLVGYNGGSISNSVAAGTADTKINLVAGNLGGGGGYTGGLVGSNYGTISTSTAKGAVSSSGTPNSGSSGGLVGLNR